MQMGHSTEQSACGRTLQVANQSQGSGSSKRSSASLGSAWQERIDQLSGALCSVLCSGEACALHSYCAEETELEAACHSELPCTLR